MDSSVISSLSPKNSFVHIPDFLQYSTYKALLDYTLARESEFQPSTVQRYAGHLDPSSRVSSVLPAFPGFQHLFVELMLHQRSLVQDICARLGVEPMETYTVECQLTAHSNGAFFKPHIDVAVGGPSRRVLSYVYYFFREPQSFQGGELRLYPDSVGPLKGTPVDYEIENNELVIFRSDILHEVLPVTCEDPAFANSRFTINGWLNVDISPRGMGS